MQKLLRERRLDVMSGEFVNGEWSIVNRYLQKREPLNKSAALSFVDIIKLVSFTIDHSPFTHHTNILKGSSNKDFNVCKKAAPVAPSTER